MVKCGHTERLLGRDLHGDLRSRHHTVVRVGLVASVHATLHSFAGRIEAGLRDGVVLSKELEDDHITDGNILQLVGLVDQTSGTANSDGVAGRGGRGSSFTTGSSRDCLGDSDLLIVGGLLSPCARVGPDDDDLCLGVGSKAVAFHLIDGDVATSQKMLVDIQPFVDLGHVLFLAIHQVSVTGIEARVSTDRRVGVADLAGQGQRGEAQS